MASGRALIGRDRELAVVDRMLAAPGRRTLVVAGPAGVGKTRLALEALDRAAQRGAATFWIPASRAAATIPFGAVAHLVAEDTTDRLSMLRRAEQRLAEARGTATPLLGVDDAQHLDDASATVVHRAVAAGSARVIATVRTGDPVPDVVTGLWTSAHGERIELGPLRPADTGQLVEDLLDGPVEGVTCEQLSRLSGGNPLYLHELIRGGLASDALRSVDGVWRWSGRVTVAPHLSTVVDDRVDRLPAAVRDAVDLVAFGEPVPLDLLERAGVDETAVERAEASGLTTTASTSGGIEVRLAHPLYGEVARARASSLRRRSISRRLAAAAGTSVDDAIRVAVWHLDGGLDDADLFRRGASRALAALDLPLAQRLAEGAVATAPGPDARGLLARVLVLRGDGARADDLLAALDVTDLPEPDAAELAGLRAWNLAFSLGRPREAEDVLVAAAARSDSGRDVLAARRAVIHGYGGRVGEALVIAGSVTCDPGADPRARLSAWTLTCQLLGVRGRHADALEAAARATALCRDLHGDDWTMEAVEILGGSAAAHLYAGDLDAAQEVADRGSRRAAAAGWRAGTAMWLSWHADIALARGAVRKALGYAREAAALADRDPQPYLGWMSRYRSLQRARIAAVLGRADDAADALAEAAARDDGTSGVLDVWGGSSAAWVAAAHREPRRAVEIALAAADRARRDDQRGWELLALHQVVRFGAASRVTARVVDVGARVDGRLAPWIVRHARAAAAADGTQLDAVASGFAELGHDLLAAEAGAQAAAAHRAGGHRSAAVAAAVRARARAVSCEGAVTPALAVLSHPEGLTRREDEIARLAALGLTNRAIAAKLVVSVRTVDNTLHQVYAKLGLGGRRELPGLFDG